MSKNMFGTDEQESMWVYRKILANPQDLDVRLKKEIVASFLIPYKISSKKQYNNFLALFASDEERYEMMYFPDPDDMDDYDFSRDEPTPTVKKMVSKQFEIKTGFPEWFVCGFPDVLIWMYDSERAKDVIRDFMAKNPSKLIGRHIPNELIKMIIDLYLEFGNELEARWKS
jgi:hypothetical protein